MQEDFHYYATYCAAYLAGYSHEESRDIAYSAQFVDCCSRSLLEKLKGPRAAATTQTQPELAEARTDLIGLQDITRIWSSFHFLPGKLGEKYPKHRSRKWLRKYQLICGPNSPLVADTVKLAKDKSLQAVGVAMHVLADTWAHREFAGTPSFVINNATSFDEILDVGGKKVYIPMIFNHNPTSSDDPDKGRYTNSLFTSDENSIMNLGHGRAGHLPDYSYIRYRFLPAWGEYKFIYKDNPADYYHAFAQMVFAMKYLRGVHNDFQVDCYEWDALDEYKDEIMGILEKNQLLSSDDWKAFGEKLSGNKIADFSLSKYQGEYMAADADLKDSTFLGKFFLAALAQKSMVTNKIFMSGNLLAGFSIDFEKKGFRGMKDYRKLIERGEGKK
ncbi:MAG: hypothetical protein Q4A32_08695 [Lachnospiraceae bacterium]|nr:hypothetical protein [Lachnospiraceae bacterium]